MDTGVAQELQEWSENVADAETRVVLARGARRIAELEAALRNVVRDVNEYERVNNLAPNPGRSECWDSVAAAKAVLQKPQ
jgi:hypothetical protein